MNLRRTLGRFFRTKRTDTVSNSHGEKQNNSSPSVLRKPIKKKKPDCIHYFMLPSPSAEIRNPFIVKCSKCGFAQKHSNAGSMGTAWARTKNGK